MSASQHGHQPIVRLLLEKGAAVNIAGTRSTALIYASQNGYEQIARLLLEAGADVNAADISQCTALIRASEHEGVVRLLLERGADVSRFGLVDIIGTMRSFNGTALHCAVRKGNFEIVRLLLKEGADGDALDPFGHSPRSLAVARGFRAIVSLLQHYSSRGKVGNG
jgi:uncharacterized protein